MKNKILPMFLFVLFVFHLESKGMDIQSGSVSFEENNATQPCITAKEYEILTNRCDENIRILGLDSGKNRMLTTSLEWPLRSTSNLTDCSYYHISAYVDQDTASGIFQDFNCGTNTYDGHTGTDIATWPFNFYKMDNNLVEVIAAAPGIIIDKHDGEFDRNCSSNNLTANYVVIQHADGSRALYWHMKKNFVTTVPIGQPVSAGEYLGVVGSSGSSSGPHLHFEVWNGSTVATRVDPYSGTCNALNPSSWWISQKNYKETAVIRASVHTTDIVVPGCPTTETLNEGPSFQIPFQGPGLPAGYAKFYIFIRDEINGMTANLSILNPGGSTYLSWTYNSTSDNKVRTWGWSKLLPTVSGTYTFQAIYNGITCSSTFVIVNPTDVSSIDMLSTIKIFPNPVVNELNIHSFDFLRIKKVDVYDVLGEKIPCSMRQAEDNLTLDVRSLPPGIYVVSVSDEKSIKATYKFVKI
jgi:hypothetical protein